MNSFSTRSAFVAMWITIGAIGAVLLAIGITHLYGTLIISDEIGNAGGFASSLLTLGLILTLIGGTIVVFCGYKIFKCVTQPLAFRNNARADTPPLRALAFMAFAAGACVGGYGLHKIGSPVPERVLSILTLDTATAKVISSEPNVNDKNYSGTFIYYVGNDRQQFSGIFNNKSKFKGELGKTFSITYEKKNPSIYHLNKRPYKPFYLLPDMMQLIFIFWMIAAGIEGMRANIWGYDEEDEEDGDNTSLMTAHMQSRLKGPNSASTKRLF